MLSSMEPDAALRFVSYEFSGETVQKNGLPALRVVSWKGLDPTVSLGQGESSQDDPRRIELSMDRQH